MSSRLDNLRSEPAVNAPAKYNLLLLRAALGDINSGKNVAEDLSRVCTIPDIQSGWSPTDTTGLSLSKRTTTESGR